MKINVNDLTFGIEIENLIPSAALATNGWHVGAYHAGSAIPAHDGWIAMRDGSLRSTNYNVTALEVVSPVLSGVAGLTAVRAMGAKLKAMGARVNASCGFHVHVGWSGNDKQLRRLVQLVAQHERALFASTGTTARERNIYCNSIRSNYRPYVDAVATVRSLTHQSRYHVLNLTNLNREAGRRTVEFRVFAGTTNTAKIVAYVQMCLALVQKSLETTGAVSFDAPVDAPKQIRENAGNGEWAVRRLFAQINWHVETSSKRAPLGAIDPSAIRASVKLIKKMAAKYDAATAR